jgi:hypothetical protein
MTETRRPLQGTVTFEDVFVRARRILFELRDVVGGELSEEQRRRIVGVLGDVFGARSRESQEERAWSPAVS